MSVAALLRRLGSTYEWPASPHTDALTVEQLMSHCSGIRQHYVHSFRPGALPSPLTLMYGLTTDMGGKFDRVSVSAAPNTEFAYSGGGFIVLEHIMELLHGCSITESMKPFLQKLGMDDCVVVDDGSAALHPGSDDQGRLVERRAFPSFAAGLICSCKSMMRFLAHLTAAFQPGAVNGSGALI